MNKSFLRFPKLKNALFCRILTYILVIGAFIAPIVVVIPIDAIPDLIKVPFFFFMLVALVVYLIKNFAVLMALDVSLAMVHCRNTSRKQFKLHKLRKISTIQQRLSRFGKSYKCTPIQPKPSDLRYKVNSSMTLYAKGIERVVAVYNVRILDKNNYSDIYRSAVANSKALMGKKKPLLVEKAQRSAPLHRVTVFVIIAQSVEKSFLESLFDTVCKQDGDAFENSIIPCVIDVERRICVFNCERAPYYGYGYPVKNRGVRIIRKAVFGGRLPLRNNPHILEPIKDVDTNQTLWEFWSMFRKELVLTDKENEERFGKMSHGDIIYEDDYLYVKWEDKGVWLYVELNEEKKTASIDPIHSWDYPKANTIAKNTVSEIKQIIKEHFANLGYDCKFLSLDD